MKHRTNKEKKNDEDCGKKPTYKTDNNLLSNDSKKEKYNILILGLDNAGKTTLYYYLIGEDNKNTRPTPGVNFKSFQYEGNKIHLYDLGGLKVIREYWKYYYYDIDALIYVFDVTDKKRIGESYELIQKLLEDDHLLNVPILFYGNKCDLTNKLDVEEVNKNFKLNNFKGRDWSLFFCSALKGKGIKDGLKWLFNLDYLK